MTQQEDPQWDNKELVQNSVDIRTKVTLSSFDCSRVGIKDKTYLILVLFLEPITSYDAIKDVKEVVGKDKQRRNETKLFG